MKNYSYHKKYHYLLKYFIMAFPLIVYLSMVFIRETEIIGNFYPNQFDDLISAFAYMPMNNWYTTLINLITNDNILDNYSNLYIMLCYYPCYILWVYILDLILDIFAMVPKLAHKLLYKLGGGIDD